LREGVIAAAPGDQMDGLPRFGWRVAKLLSRRNATGVNRAERLSRAIDRLGPSYVKLGQFLATRPDVVGAALARDLSSLQDRMATFPTEQSLALIEGSLGVPAKVLFTEID